MAGKWKIGFVCVSLLAATGCADMTDKQRSTAIGTGVGALGGAAIGSFSGNAGWGALIGAGVGAAGGLAVGQARENERRAYQRGVESGRNQQ
ncbi:MAG: glycine zipper domain-containing protein [Acetobacteraceae bacterium]